MTKLVPILLDDQTVIYIEAEDDVASPDVPITSDTTRVAKDSTQIVLKSFQALQGTIRAYTKYTLDAFKEMATANVDKVTLEFGVKIGAEASVPYITKGTSECNLKITVECSLPKEKI